MDERAIANRWLEEKGIKQLLQRIVVSLLQTKPANPEEHIIQFLQASAPKEELPRFSAAKEELPRFSAAKEEEAEAFPTLGGAPVALAPRISSGAAPAGPRRASLVSQRVLSREGSSQRRKGMSSKMTSSTTVEIRVVPKDPETTARLLETVNRVELFSFLQPEPKQQLVDAMFEMNFEDGGVIIRQGDAPDNFYILAEGDVSILKKMGDRGDVQVAVLHPGACFGELALISGSVRSATVVAIGAVKCWAIDQTTYLGLLKERHAAKRQRYKSLLKQVPALQVLEEYEILLVADALQAVTPVEGQEIVRQGDSGDEFFIILEGTCRVLKAEGDGGPREVAVLENGGYFGELALLRDVPRSATVVAGAGCKLIKLDRASFHRLLGPCSQIFAERIKSYTSTG
jgi:cAMP-dependent protein kinase regulator